MVEVFYLWLLTILENSQPRWNAVSMLRVKMVSSNELWENKNRKFKIFKILILSVSCKFLSESPSRLEKIWNRTSNGRSLKWTDWQRFRDRFTLLDALQQFLACSDWKYFLNSLFAQIKKPEVRGRLRATRPGTGWALWCSARSGWESRARVRSNRPRFGFVFLIYKFIVLMIVALFFLIHRCRIGRCDSKLLL